MTGNIVDWRHELWKLSACEGRPLADRKGVNLDRGLGILAGSPWQPGAVRSTSAGPTNGGSVEKRDPHSMISRNQKIPQALHWPDCRRCEPRSWRSWVAYCKRLGDSAIRFMTEETGARRGRRPVEFSLRHRAKKKGGCAPGRMIDPEAQTQSGWGNRAPWADGAAPRQTGQSTSGARWRIGFARYKNHGRAIAPSGSARC